VVLAALAVGLAYATISASWGLGVTWLLSTVSASLATAHRDAAAMVAMWAAVVLRAAAALLPLLACRPTTHSKWHRRFRVVAWAEGAALTVYGFALTSVGLALQAGNLHPGKTADRRALAWRAYLSDPWFLVWGLLVVITLRMSHRAET
jgi:uncharacterized protein DUF3995